MCVGVSVWLGWSGIRVAGWSTNSNTHRTKNNTTNSHKLLMTDILMPETCWAHKKWNKIASDIKLVFYSSTITMMHGPINMRLNNVSCVWSNNSNKSTHVLFHCQSACVCPEQTVTDGTIHPVPWLAQREFCSHSPFAERVFRTHSTLNGGQITAWLPIDMDTFC